LSTSAGTIPVLNPEDENSATVSAEARSQWLLYMYEGPWSLFSKGSYNVVSSPPKDTFAIKNAAIHVHKSQIARTPYDRASESLALLRGALVPEMDLSGFGEEPPRLEDRLELFFHICIKSTGDVQHLLKLVDNVSPPSINPNKPTPSAGAGTGVGSTSIQL